MTRKRDHAGIGDAQNCCDHEGMRRPGLDAIKAGTGLDAISRHEMAARRSKKLRQLAARFGAAEGSSSDS